MKMSSSSNNLNPFAYITSSSHQYPVPLPPVCSHEPESFFIQQNYLYPLSLSPPFLATNISPMLPIHFIAPNGATMAEKDVNISPGNSLNRKPVNKDRHRKIYTAQGLRDRRVRLSVEISRKFFGLQDMLGYDKASKTLEWLLSKSRKAIKELVKTKNNCREVENRAESVEEGSSEEKNMESLNKVGVTGLLAKESREKARARARKRTMEKMIILNQFRPLISQNMAEKSAVMEKKKMKLPMLPGSNFPEEGSSKNNTIFTNFPGNWEINMPFERRSNCNLSTELNIQERSSEAYNNQNLP